MHILTYSDGGARGNPGPAAIGFVIYSADNLATPLETHAAFIGERKTNNEAEYMALKAALTCALSYSPTKITCYLDSELVVKQLAGAYRVKNSTLQKEYEAISALRAQAPMLEFKHIPRAKNALADRLVNEALDMHMRV